MDKISLYKEMFDIFAKGNKSFGTKELGEIMQLYGMKPSDLELQDMISQLDINASGQIEFKEFYAFMTRKIKRDEADEELREALKLFDIDGNGYISVKVLRDAMHNLGERLSNEEIDEMVREINFDDDSGEINIDEFINILGNKK